MTVGDFFHFDPTEYATRISTYTPERLCKQEIVKTRQNYAASMSISTGIGGALFTCGASLAVTAYGLRRKKVAKKKRKIIEAELTSRASVSTSTKTRLAHSCAGQLCWDGSWDWTGRDRNGRY
jgi:hypothetical protein